MEPKAILYLTIAVGYVVYTLVKKNQESKSQAPRQTNPNAPAKPVSPPVGDPLADIMREIKRKQAEAEAAKAKQIIASKPKPLTSTQPKKQPKELLVHEKKKGVFEEGNYERYLTDEEKIERGKLDLANEGIYKIKSVEEMEEEEGGYRIDVRSAIIGAAILEKEVLIMAEAAEIFTGADSLSKFAAYISSNTFSQTFLLVDENTLKHCYPKLKKQLSKHTLIKIKSGEQNKTITSCELIWQKLTTANADRNALLINLGGGVIGDMGGFAAGCYKRGIKFVNVPTTLLAMVDASVGAKTGIDFQGFKNQIGLFNEPEAVFIDTAFLKTLPQRELKAGLAEVIKHYLVADKAAFEDLAGLLINRKGNIGLKDLDWQGLVEKNIATKAAIVAQDKFETGPRKALNFGHTVGHAVESYFLSRKQKVLHGEAVAVGIICEAYISKAVGKVSGQELDTIVSLVTSTFRNLPPIQKRSIPAIVKLMQQDKKNAGSKNQFTLLNGVGGYLVNNTVAVDIIIRSLQFYSELS